MAINSNVEILYVQSSSIDQKGMRVLIRLGGCENCIFPQDDMEDASISLLGMSPADKKHIQQFFKSAES